MEGEGFVEGRDLVFLWSWKMLFWLFLDNESGYLGQRFVLGLEFNQTEMVFARKKVCWHNSCNAYFAIILMRLTMSNDGKVTSTITKDHIRVVHKSYSGRSRTKYLTCT